MEIARNSSLSAYHVICLRSMEFKNLINDYLLSPDSQVPYPVLYRGPRPKNSFQLHLKHSYPFQYPRMNPNTKKLLEPAFVPSDPTPPITFDSNFESGNLDVVIQTKPFEYDLYMRVDSNTVGHNQWYFFKVKNTQVATLKFRICNFTKPNSLYNRGMLPYIYSTKQDYKSGTGWKQAGSNVNYKKRLTNYESVLTELTSK